MYPLSADKKPEINQFYGGKVDILDSTDVVANSSMKCYFERIYYGQTMMWLNTFMSLITRTLLSKLQKLYGEHIKLEAKHISSLSQITFLQIKFSFF